MAKYLLVTAIVLLVIVAALAGAAYVGVSSGHNGQVVATPAQTARQS